MTDTSVDDFLAHHGVKGMHWGKHKAESGGSGSSGPSRKQARTDAKIEKAKAAQKNDEAIKKARENLGKNSEKLDKAFSQYQVDKLTKGKAKANEIYNKAASKPMAELDKANESTTGEHAIERANAIVGTVALVGMSAIMIGLSGGIRR